MMRALLTNIIVSLRQRLLYFATMGGASLLTFARGLVVASIMQVADFGVYVTLVAIGIFSSSLVSFGKIEGFMKSLPRHWAAGDHDRVRSHCDSAALALTKRGLIVGLPAALALQLYSQAGMEALLVTAFAIGTSWYSIYSAGIRATANVDMLGKANIVRTASAVVLVPLGGWLFGWGGAMMGELVSATMAGLILRRWLADIRPPEMEQQPAAVSESTERGGLEVYLGLILVAAPLYFDRLFVGQAYGLAVAGTYAFLLIFQMLNSTLVGIVVQSVGPDLVRLEHAGATLRQQIRKIVLWSGFCIFVSTAAIAALTFAVFVWPMADLRVKYGIDIHMVIAISVLSFFRVSEFIDWMFISRNSERAMLLASAGSFVAMIVVAFVTVSMGLDFLTFIWLVVAARALQVVMQLAQLPYVTGRH